MSCHFIANQELWDKKNHDFKHGSEKLEKWHEEARIRRINKKIEERKRLLAEKHINESQNKREGK